MTTQPIDLFWEACAAKGPLQLSVRHRRERRATTHVLQQPFVLMGRDGKCDLVLEGEQVSRRHAFLQVVAGRLYCVDLQSRTGIHWATGSQPAGWLAFNEALRVGPYILKPLPNRGEANQDAHLASFAEPPRLPSVNLDFALDDSHKGTWHMKGLVVQVGGAPDCGVQLVDPSISRYHCSLVRTPKGVWVVDLLGRGGICVNGVAIRCARLKDRDELQVGRFMVRFRQDPVAEAEKELPLAFPLGRSFSLPDFYKRAAGTGPETPGNPVLLPGPSSASSIDKSVDTPGEVPPPPQEVKLFRESMPPGELTNASLLPLVNQFSTLHQQMFGQFQQATLMMVQMFTTLQGEQLGLIREELDRLHRLTEELQKLRTGTVDPGKPVPGNSVTDVAATVPVRPSAAPSKPGNGVRQRTNGAADAQRPGNGRPANGATPTGKAPKSAASAAEPKTPAPDLPEGSMHAWITQRIAAIQEEQQSSWQRILQYVVGRRAEDPSL